MGTVTEIIKALEPYEEKLVIQIILGYIDVEIPFLNLPIISQVTQLIVTEFVGLIVNRLNILTINVATIIEVGMENDSFKSAAEKNYEAQNGGTDIQKQEAIKSLLEVSRNFIHFDLP